MTSKQRLSILLDRWPAACRTQQWNPKDRDLRLHTISQAVGRPITSMNDLDNATDIDRVFAHLGILSERLAAIIESSPTGEDYGYRRRLYWLIRKHARPLGGEPYILQLARDRFHLVPGLRTIEDLTTPQLHQLMMTLNARQHSSRRRQSAHSNESLTSEATSPDQVEFSPEPESEFVAGPF